MTEPQAEKKRASYLTVAQMFNLHAACRCLHAFGYGTYLVGSCLTTPSYRDVDLRCIVPDAEFSGMFGSDEHVESRLKMLNVAISEWIQSRTGLPIDFQFQQATSANSEFDGLRHFVGR